MKKIRTYAIEYIVAIVILLLLAFFMHTKTENRQEQDADFARGWRLVVDNQEIDYAGIAGGVIESDGEICLKKKLETSDCGNNCGLSFFTVHCKVWIEIDGIEQYRFDQKGATFSKTSGHELHLFALPLEYAGKEIAIYIRYPYKTSSMEIPLLNGGELSELLTGFTSARLFSFISSMFMIVVGGLMIICYICMVKQKRFEKSLAWLGFFAISFGVWSVLESQMFVVFVNNKVLLNQMTVIALKMTYIPMMRFFDETFHKNNRLIEISFWVNAGDLILTSMLQLLGIADYKQTLWITHGCMFVGIGYILFNLLGMLLVQLKRMEWRTKTKLILSINGFGIFLVALCVVFDVVRFYTSRKRRDSATFSRFGLLIYIVILGMELLKKSFRLIDVEREAEKLKREARMDAVTKLGNRTAFQEDVEAIERKNYPAWSVIMCDLNGLKFFNDHYGHSMGDSYIIIAAELICDMFGSYGKIYRVGGDEFIVLSDRLNEQIFAEQYEQMKQRIEALNKSYFQERMGIAAGFAAFDAALDVDLYETEKRADIKMYAVKKEMKEKNSKFRRYETEGGS